MNNSLPKEKRLMQTHVYVDGKCYDVSTINRQCSAMGAQDMWYAETIVWEYDIEKRARGEILYQDEDSKGSVRTHIRICGLIFNREFEAMINEQL